MAVPQLSRTSLVAWSAVAIVVTGVVGGAWLGLPVAILFIAGAALVSVIFLLWNSVQSLTGETPLTVEEAVMLGAPSAEEERKRAVLRALKDLDYERAVGKISEEDYRELSVRYRLEAKELLQALDETLAPARARAEARLAERLKSDAAGAKKKNRRKKKASKPTPADGESPDLTEPVMPSDVSSDGDSTTDDVIARRACPGCATPNESDAHFCKGCGKSLEELAEVKS